MALTSRHPQLQHLLLSVMLIFAAGTIAPASASVKVAFVADQGVDSNAQAVLSLIASEGTDLVLLQGDFGYIDDSAQRWEQNLIDYLGKDFPVLSVIGNHDDAEWVTYKQFIRDRVARVDGLECNGRIGIKAHCTFGPLEIVHVSPGIHEEDSIDPDDDYAGYIDAAFDNSTTGWRICSWHKNQQKMQTGSKSDATGWSVYEACRRAGALIATGHEHAYSRTYLLSNFENQTIVHKDSTMVMQPGQSFAFVSGLGGWEVREQKTGGDWWASIYTSTQGATHGALFCEFQETAADCYFKAIDGSIPDQFRLELPGADTVTQVDVDPTPPIESEPTPPTEPESVEAELPPTEQESTEIALISPEELEASTVEPTPIEPLEATEITAEALMLQETNGSENESAPEPAVTAQPLEQLGPATESETAAQTLQPLVVENEGDAAADLTTVDPDNAVARGQLSWPLLIAFWWLGRRRLTRPSRHSSCQLQ